MPGLSDILGASGVLEQIALYGVVQNVMQSLLAPAFTTLQQDSLSEHPITVLTSDILARAVAQYFISEAQAADEAAKSGVDSRRFRTMLDLARIRIQPADLAESVLRAVMTQDEAERQAKPQGYTPEMLQVLIDLAGDAPGPDELAQMLRRGIIDEHGRGPGAVTYDQGIAESRLRNKWAGPIAKLYHAIISPPDAASAVVRGFLPFDHAAKLAELSGVDRTLFATMVQLSGDAPSPGQLSEALRRKIIPRDSGNPDVPGFLQGIREGRLSDKWAEMIERLAQLWPTPVDALDALLKGQVTEEEGKHLYELFGGAPEFFTLLFHTQGESPTPLELITMANRGFIPWNGLGADVTSYEQGFKEGRWRNKWAAAYRHFAVYVPPESTVVTLLSHGVIRDEAAADLLAKQGMDAELIRAYIDEAHTEALSDYRGATVTTVLAAYHAGMLDADQAKPILYALHVTPTAANFLLAYEDIQRAFEAVNNAISRVRTLFAARKITVQTVKDALRRLELPPKEIDKVVAEWEVENSISVKVLTEAQIIDAEEIGALTADEAMTELQNIGYTPFDAWVLRSNKKKTPLPNKPKQGAAPPQAQVIPGTT